MLALGEPALLAGYALAGVVVAGAREPHQVRAAWDAADPDVVALVLLTPEAATALGERRYRPGSCLSAVIP